MCTYTNILYHAIHFIFWCTCTMDQVSMRCILESNSCQNTGIYLAHDHLYDCMITSSTPLCRCSGYLSSPLPVGKCGKIRVNLVVETGDGSLVQPFQDLPHGNFITVFGHSEDRVFWTLQIPIHYIALFFGSYVGIRNFDVVDITCTSEFYFFGWCEQKRPEIIQNFSFLCY